MKMTYLEAAGVFFALLELAGKEWPVRTHKRIEANIKELQPVGQQFIQDRDVHKELPLVEAEKAVVKDWTEAGLEKEFQVFPIDLGDYALPGHLYQRLKPILEIHDN